MKTFTIGEYQVRKLDSRNWVIEKEFDVIDSKTNEAKQEMKILGYYNSVDEVFNSLLSRGVDDTTEMGEFKEWRDEVVKGYKEIQKLKQ